jgi:pimeloyl-ACP methyl ester carboxylesterase
MIEPTLSTITVCGASVLVKRAGAGAAMLMLHGQGGAPRFHPAMQALAERFEVIIPIAPGFGGSPAPSWLETISDLANFYLEFLETLDLRDVHLVGLSLGGWVAADVAVRNASRLASLTLVDAPGIEVPGVAYLDPSSLSPEEAVRANYFDPRRGDESVLRMLAPENEAVRLSNQRLVAKLAWATRYHDPQLQRWLHRIRIPTLVLWGANDRLFPPAYGAAWHAAIPGSRLVVLERCGHLPIQEKPEAFTAIVGEFCAGARRD